MSKNRNSRTQYKARNSSCGGVQKVKRSDQLKKLEIRTITQVRHRQQGGWLASMKELGKLIKYCQAVSVKQETWYRWPATRSCTGVQDAAQVQALPMPQLEMSDRRPSPPPKKAMLVEQFLKTVVQAHSCPRSEWMARQVSVSHRLASLASSPELRLKPTHDLDASDAHAGAERPYEQSCNYTFPPDNADYDAPCCAFASGAAWRTCQPWSFDHNRDNRLHSNCRVVGRAGERVGAGNVDWAPGIHKDCKESAWTRLLNVWTECERWGWSGCGIRNRTACNETSSRWDYVPPNEQNRKN